MAETRVPRVGHVLVSGAGGAAGRALCAQLLMRGVEVTGADPSPAPAPGMVTLPVPPSSAPGFAAGLAATARRAGAELVIPADPREVSELARAWNSLRAAPPALLPAPEAAAIVSSPLLLARALVRACLPPPPSTGRRFHRYAVCAFVADDPRDDVAVVLRRTVLCRADVGQGPGLARVEAPDVARAARAAARAVGLRGPAEVHALREPRGPALVSAIVPCFGPASLHAPEVLDAVMASVRRAAPRRVGAAVAA